MVEVALFLTPLHFLVSMISGCYHSVSPSLGPLWGGMQSIYITSTASLGELLGTEDLILFKNHSDVCIICILILLFSPNGFLLGLKEKSQ